MSAKSLSPDEGRRKYGTIEIDRRINGDVKVKIIVDSLQTQVEQLQTEIMNVQIKYQKELEKLEKENRDLRQQYLIMKTNRKTGTKKIKVKLLWLFLD